MPYDPRAPMQAPVQQFPAEPLMDPQSLAMIQRRMLGGTPQGLLDTSNAPAGLLGPPTVRPDILSGAGLLTPIIWDRLQRGLSPMTATEGAIPGYGGGGRGQQSLDLRGGSGEAPPGYRAAVAGAEPKLDWRSYSEGNTHRTTTKSGMRVVVDKDPHVDGTVDVTFLEPPGGVGGRGSTKRGIGRFEEVFGAVKDYVQGFRPDRLRFTGLTEKHDMLYERVAPRMAQALGGVLRVPKKGNFIIELGRGGE